MQTGLKLNCGCYSIHLYDWLSLLLVLYVECLFFIWLSLGTVQFNVTSGFNIPSASYFQRFTSQAHSHTYLVKSWMGFPTCKWWVWYVCTVHPLSTQLSPNHTVVFVCVYCYVCPCPVSTWLRSSVYVWKPITCSLLCARRGMTGTSFHQVQLFWVACPSMGILTKLMVLFSENAMKLICSILFITYVA